MVASKATFIRPAMAAHNQIGPHYLKWHRITSRNMLIQHHRHILSIQSSSAMPNKNSRKR